MMKILSICNLVKNVIPQSLSPPGTVLWQQQGPPSPSSISSGSTSPGYSPSRTLDLSGSSTSFSSERKAAHHWQNGPVQEWTKEQVKKLNSFFLLIFEHSLNISFLILV